MSAGHLCLGGPNGIIVAVLEDRFPQYFADCLIAERVVASGDLEAMRWYFEKVGEAIEHAIFVDGRYGRPQLEARELVLAELARFEALEGWRCESPELAGRFVGYLRNLAKRLGRGVLQ
jgi:hypothetical protein